VTIDPSVRQGRNVTSADEMAVLLRLNSELLQSAASRARARAAAAAVIAAA